MTIALVDDDARFRAQTARLLESVLEERGVRAEVFAFDSAEKLLEARADGLFDIYLLDVMMPGMDGMALGRRIRVDQPDALIVFLTTSRDFALEAYGVHAADYMVKPFAHAAFAEAIVRALRLLSALRHQTLVLKAQDGFVNISPQEFVFAEADGRHQIVHVADGRSFTTRMTLQELGEKLGEDSRFVRIGRQLLVNLAHVKKYADGTLLLSTGQMFAVPRRSLAEVKAALSRFYGE